MCGMSDVFDDDVLYMYRCILMEFKLNSKPDISDYILGNTVNPLNSIQSIMSSI